MADYKLKIEIDAEDFTRKIQDALKKAGIGGMGSAGGSSAGNKYSKMFSERGEGTYTKAGADRIKNTLLKIDARRTQHAQDALDKLEYMVKMTEQQNIRAKNRAKAEFQKRVFGGMGTSLVKIAGFTMGISGLAGLAKGLIDASPMLQAMLKVLQAGILFVLRPIGDFLGFLLRPFVILMLRYAVDFYKNYGKDFIEAGKNTADFIGKAIDRIGSAYGFAGPEKFNEYWSNADKTLKKQWEDFWNGLIGDKAWEDWGKRIQSFTDYLLGDGGTVPLFLAAFADTGEEAEKNIDIFTRLNDALIYIYNTAKRIATKPIGVNDFNDIGQAGAHAAKEGFSGQGKYMPRDTYDSLVAARGQDFADRYLENRGYAGVQAVHKGTSGLNQRKSGGFTIIHNTIQGDVISPEIFTEINKKTQKKHTTVRLVE